MTTSAAIRFHSVQNPVRTFSWGKHSIVGVTVAAIFLAAKANGYVGGLRFEGFSAFSPILPFLLSLIILVPLLLIGTLRGLYRILTKRDHWQKLGILSLPFVATLGVASLPIPSFNEGVSKTLRGRVTSEELISFARSMIDTPPSWMSTTGYHSISFADNDWMKSNRIVDKSGLSSCPNVQIEKETVLFHAGSPIADRWGIAISARPGEKPELPRDTVSSLAIYPEVWVFTLMD